MPRQPRKIDCHARGEKDVEHVARFVAWIRLYLCNLLRFVDQPFRQQESGSQLLVLTRGAHGHTDRAGVDLYFEGFLRGYFIALADRFCV